MDRYAVFGNPIGHSKSPLIHRAFAQQTGQPLTYDAVLVPQEGFEIAVADFFDHGGKGLNITVPFKQQAWAAAQWRTPAAELAGAVNTLYRDAQGRLCGDNTDGVGMVRDIVENHGGMIRGKRVLVLGAGGAVRGVLQPLLEQRPETLVIANRTVARAEELACLFEHLGPVRGCGFDDLDGQVFDLVINGTAASLAGELPPLPSGLLENGAWCYDMMYAAESTPFCDWARAQGASVVLDGLGMLVEQAAESFAIWRGTRPETGTVARQVREALTA
ncbi:shikimate dehydrogenase (NADP(+)) [Marinobacterium nitratireducens]|uniref:Shikimate dehydrogenase (NADP(+)) n=1 Tax=Marinobacterium nitratireducens TaxID=518897 RepID=A0A917Z8J0_9GAMM|nr:shikimate dehydrogenase [Marinobacterium nitratireducens]GGO77452.1 shikimate dehydrogenase (NADP(+)) [Marinobacterium nitratireducens]